MTASTARIIGLSCVVSILHGCASVASPYGGESGFNCSARFMDGIPCDSISGTAKNFQNGNLPWQKKALEPAASSSPVKAMKETVTQGPIKAPIQDGQTSGPPQEKLSPRNLPTLTTGFPMRTADRVLRIWVAPYEDDEGALNDQKYVFLKVDKGQWQIQANKLAIRAPYRQISPLSRNRELPQEVDTRASGRAQAQEAVVANPNLTNLPAQSQPTTPTVREDIRE
jgi:conjugal transfer pilus assembly protein TraV